jgi:CheY-like chemotaxis protein
MQAEYKILAVDDSAEDLVLIREAFAECGEPCHLTFATTPDEAKSFLERESFDLVICDYSVGGQGMGESLIHSIRERAPMTPIVVLSGYSDPRAAYAAGANAFVMKPGNFDQFIETVRGIMAFWVGVAILPQRKKPGSVASRNTPTVSEV